MPDPNDTKDSSLPVASDRKTADRPHRVTVVLTLVAVVVSTFSAWLSFQALVLNREFNIAAQQAYLTVRNPQMEVMEETLRGGRVTNLVFTIEVYNAGNTPATDVFVEQTAFFGLSNNSPPTNPKELELITRVDLIGPKDTAQIRQIIHIPPVYVANRKFLNKVLLRGTASYQTRFSAHAEMFQWCRNYDEGRGFSACSLSYIPPLK